MPWRGGNKRIGSRRAGVGLGLAAALFLLAGSGCVTTMFPFLGNGTEPPILPPPAPTPYPETFGVQMSRMLEQIHKLEDERKTLTNRIQRQDLALGEKDQLLNQSAAELEKSLETLAKTRRDLEENRDELTRARLKLEQLEKSDRAAFQSILESLEKIGGPVSKIPDLPSKVPEFVPKKSGGGN